MNWWLNELLDAKRNEWMNKEKSFNNLMNLRRKELKIQWMNE